MKITYLPPHIVKKIIIVCVVSAGILFSNSLYIQAKAIMAQYMIAQAWRKTLTLNERTTNHKPIVTVKPWEWADTYPIAKITVPNHNIEQFVLAGASGSPLAFAPGLYSGTQLPNNYSSTIPDAVIAGHHNTHFSFLADIDYGDVIHIQTHTGATYSFTVTKIETFDIRTQRLPSYYGGTTLQLVTCKTQYTGEIHPAKRLVITASLQKNGSLNNLTSM